MKGIKNYFKKQAMRIFDLTEPHITTHVHHTSHLEFQTLIQKHKFDMYLNEHPDHDKIIRRDLIDGLVQQLVNESLIEIKKIDNLNPYEQCETYITKIMVAQPHPYGKY